MSGALAEHAYRHGVLWPVGDKWRESLQDVGGEQMAFVRRLFASRAWWKLEPEPANELVTQGRGKVGDNDYITAARATDGSLAIVYILQSHPFTIDLSRLKPVQGHPLPNRGVREFVPPVKNASDESDWVLLLETAK